MEKQILVAGFGGQGVLSIGLFLTYAAMSEGRNVSYVPSYGAEMRGGTANCIVTIADEEISSPLTENPRDALILNRPSLDRFEERIQSGGVLIINSSLVDREPQREDLQIRQLPLNEMADKIGAPRSANMIMLGAYIAFTGIVDITGVLDGFEDVFKGRKSTTIDRNRKAFMTGVEYARNNW